MVLYTKKNNNASVFGKVSNFFIIYFVFLLNGTIMDIMK